MSPPLYYSSLFCSGGRARVGLVGILEYIHTRACMDGRKLRELQERKRMSRGPWLSHTFGILGGPAIRKISYTGRGFYEAYVHISDTDEAVGGTGQ